MRDYGINDWFIAAFIKNIKATTSMFRIRVKDPFLDYCKILVLWNSDILKIFVR